MSLLMMTKAFGLKVGNPARKLVLLKLADNANDNGECWPSYQYIADQCEMSRRTVISHISALVKQGLLIKTQRRVSDVQNATNLYKLNLEGGGENNSLGSETDSPGSENNSLGGGENNSPGTCHSLEPVIEPKKNNKKKKSPPKPDIDFSVFGDVTEEQVSEIKRIRKLNNKNRPISSQRVANRMAGEFKKAINDLGMSFDDCLTEWETRGWATFEAQWVINRNKNTHRPANQTYQKNGVMTSTFEERMNEGLI